jgi:AraC-like DNA-binding protein
MNGSFRLARIEHVKRRIQTARQDGKHVRLQRIDRLISLYLRHCYRERTPAKVKELALFVQRSRPYLSRAVTDVSDVTLRNLMRQKQAAHAEAMLHVPGLTVHEIARRCAFGDVKTFYRAFVKWYGLLPGIYRSRLPNAHRPKKPEAVSSKPSLRKDGKK